MTIDPKNEQIREAFKEAFANARRDGKIPRRTRAEVTADRLGDDAAHYHALLSGEERDAIGIVVQALREIADGERS